MALSLAKRRSPRDVNLEVSAILADLEGEPAGGSLYDLRDPPTSDDYDELFGSDADLSECGAKLRLCGGVAFRGFNEE